MSNDPSSPDADPKKPIVPSEKSGKDHIELDLWDLDAEGMDATGGGAPPAGIPSKRQKESSIKSRVPTERASDRPILSKDQPDETMDDLDPPAQEPAPTVTREKPPAKKRGKKSNVVPIVNRELSDIGELDDHASPPIPEPVPEVKNEEVSTAGEMPAEPRTVPAPEVEDAVEPADDGETPSLPGKTFLVSLSKVEKIGIASLIAIFAIAAAFAIIHFSNRVPTRELIARPLSLPIRGEWLTATAVSTYWREPVLTGDESDTVRRGTMLIPVIRITLEGGPAAVRVFFRNEDGIVVGDGITRSVGDGGELNIAATAGYDDIGMHAAYRTGESQPWVVQVFEAPSPNAPREQFKKFLETEISTDLR